MWSLQLKAEFEYKAEEKKQLAQHRLINPKGTCDVRQKFVPTAMLTINDASPNLQAISLSRSMPLHSWRLKTSLSMEERRCPIACVMFSLVSA